MEYSKNINEIIMREYHKFVYGSAQDREELLKNIACDYNFSAKDTGPVGVYLKDPGLPDFNMNPKMILDSTSIINRYFEVLVAFNILDKLLNELSSYDLEAKRADLVHFFNLAPRLYKFSTIEEVKKELELEIEIYRKGYTEFSNTGIYPSFLKDVRIRYIMLDMLARKIRLILPNIERINLIIDKDSTYSEIYTRVINSYINRRIAGDLTITVGCLGVSDWLTNKTIKADKILYTHDYTIVNLDDYKRVRK